MLSSILFNCQVVCDKWALEKKVSRTLFLVQLHKQNVYNVEVTSRFCEVIQIRSKPKQQIKNKIKASFNSWSNSFKFGQRCGCRKYIELDSNTILQGHIYIDEGTQSNNWLHLFLLIYHSANTFTFKRHMRLFSVNRRNKASISNFSNVKLF